ncbi:MAG: hypothetical protein DRI99_07840 [Candidatus Aminicenantes bacterium]|nr:MAG: hypothetical protein DRI99_07840 [Candidatus Aminicenantes bacterium]
MTTKGDYSISGGGTPPDFFCHFCPMNKRSGGRPQTNELIPAPSLTEGLEANGFLGILWG